MAGAGRRAEVNDRSEVEGAAVRTEEFGGEPAAPEDGTDVARRTYVHARHAEVAWLHPCQVVYEYPQGSYRWTARMPPHSRSRYSSTRRRWQCSGPASLHSNTVGTLKRSLSSVSSTRRSRRSSRNALS